MYQENPYNPWPLTFGESTPQYKAVAETQLDSGVYRFVFLRARAIDDRRRELYRQGQIGEIAPLADYISRGEVSLDSPWLYVVSSFTVRWEFLVDQETASDHAMAWREKLFDSFNKVLEYCQTEYGLQESDFNKEWQTHFPQW
jgi:hypothetical protein